MTDPDEHAHVYALAERVYAGYGDYLAKNAPRGRRIPLFRLRAAQSPATAVPPLRRWPGQFKAGTGASTPSRRGFRSRRQLPGPGLMASLYVRPEIRGLRSDAAGLHDLFGQVLEQCIKSCQ